MPSTKTDSKDILKIARARKEEHGKFGYIDQNYQVVVDYEYDYVYDFINSYGVVNKGGQYGVVEATGNIVRRLQQVESSSMEVAEDEYRIFRDPDWHIRMARGLIGTSNLYAVRYEIDKNKFIVFPEEFYERNIPAIDQPNFDIYRRQHGFFSVGAFMSI